MAVVRDLDMDLRAGVSGSKDKPSTGRFAESAALLGRLNAMIDGVADEVDEGIGDLVDDAFVEFGIAANGEKIDLFAEFSGQVADQTPVTGEGGLDREHAEAHRVVAQKARQPFGLFGDMGDFDVAGLGGKTGEAGLRRGEFADNVDELIELGGGNAETGGGESSGRAGFF